MNLYILTFVANVCLTWLPTTDTPYVFPHEPTRVDVYDANAIDGTLSVQLFPHLYIYTTNGNSYTVQCEK